jgi:hypothetical protein
MPDCRTIADGRISLPAIFVDSCEHPPSMIDWDSKGHHPLAEIGRTLFREITKRHSGQI